MVTSVGLRMCWMVLLLVAVAALITSVAAQTPPMQLVLRGSEPIQPVVGDYIPASYRDTDGTVGLIKFYPVSDNDQSQWSSSLPSFPQTTTIDLVVLPGAFRDMAGNPNRNLIHARLTVGSEVTSSFWQLY